MVRDGGMEGSVCGPVIRSRSLGGLCCGLSPAQVPCQPSSTGQEGETGPDLDISISRFGLIHVG